MSMSHGLRGTPADMERPELQAARQRVLDACNSAGIAFLDGCTEENLAEKLATGVRIIPGTPEPQGVRGDAQKGRRQVQLDNPAWLALSGEQREFGLVGERAARYQVDVSPIAAVADQSAEALQELAGFVEPGGVVAVVDPGEPPKDLWRLATVVPLTQWYCPDPVPEQPTDLDWVELGDARAPDMYRLVKETDPGPFERRTHLLGDYVGVIRDGNLVAMAGERICLPGFREVSAVCTDPGFTAGVTRKPWSGKSPCDSSGSAASPSCMCGSAARLSVRHRASTRRLASSAARNSACRSWCGCERERHDRGTAGAQVALGAGVPHRHLDPRGGVLLSRLHAHGSCGRARKPDRFALPRGVLRGSGLGLLARAHDSLLRVLLPRGQPRHLAGDPLVQCAGSQARQRATDPGERLHPVPGERTGWQGRHVPLPAEDVRKSPAGGPCRA